MSIKVSNLTHVYNKNTSLCVHAIDNISFEANTGEFIGIIGHTGSGKSTLIQHLNGLLKPDFGTIEINSQLYTRENIIEIRKRVGLVFQYPEYQLFEETVEQDIAFGPKNLGLSSEEIEERIVYSLNAVGLLSDEIRKASPFELSGGQKRRVAIAGILAMKPDVLILDEPISGLDPLASKEMMEMLYREHKSSGRTTIMVSHSMDDVAKYADKILVLHSGKAVDFGTPSHIFKNPENLIRMGLDLPKTIKFSSLLKEKGFDISNSIFDEDELCEILISQLKNRNSKK